MNTRQRLTVLVALVVALMLTPAMALAQSAPTLADLKVMAPDAAAKYEKAQAHLQDIDGQLSAAREKLTKVKSDIPSTPGQEVRAAATAMGGAFSSSLAKRADKTALNIRQRDELTTRIQKLTQEREKAAADAADAKKQAELWRSELDKAQAVANAEAAQAAEVARAAHAPAIRLMIDPGHGGHDPGAVGNGLLEKDTNLAIGRKVADAAARQGWNVAMTRSDDTFIPLDQRPAMAAAWGATAFVSIHSNGGNAAPDGNMTIYRTPDGAVLGQDIMQQIAPLTGYGDIGNTSDYRGLAVLRGAKMSATLVEVMSVTPPSEAAELANPDVQTAYAEAIVRGVADFHGIAYLPPAAAAPAAPAAAAPAAASTDKPAASVEATTAPAAKTDDAQPRENKFFEQLLMLLSK